MASSQAGLNSLETELNQPFSFTLAFSVIRQSIPCASTSAENTSSDTAIPLPPIYPMAMLAEQTRSHKRGCLLRHFIIPGDNLCGHLQPQLQHKEVGVYCLRCCGGTLRLPRLGKCAGRILSIYSCVLRTHNRDMWKTGWITPGEED